MMTTPTAAARIAPNAISPTRPLNAGITMAIWAAAWLAWNMLPAPKLPPMHMKEKTSASTRPVRAQPSSLRPSSR